MMFKRILFLLFIFILFTAGGWGQTDDSDLLNGYFGSHQLGARLGVWANMGDIPPGLLVRQNNSATLASKIANSNFYFEGYFAFRISPLLMTEFSVGMSNRGSVTLTEFGTTNVGNLIIYPMLLQLKVYPFSVFHSRIQPYLAGGGGMYYGRRSSRLSTVGFITNLSSESGTDFYYSLGGGFDMPLSNTLALELNTKYMPINFSKSLITIEKYDGLSITVGIKYLYNKNKDDKTRKGRHRENRH